MLLLALLRQDVMIQFSVLLFASINLFNNDTNVFRVAINADSTKDTEFIRQLADQGGVKVTS